MHIEMLPSAAEFLAATESLRASEPILTNHIGGIAAAVVAGTTYESELWILAIDDDAVVGCAMRTAPWPMVASPMSRAAAIAIGTAVAARGERPDVVFAPSPVGEAIAEGMGRQSQVAAREIVRVLGTLRDPAPCAGRARIAEAADLALVHAWFSAFNVEAGVPKAVEIEGVRRMIDAGSMWLWEIDGVAVAMAGNAALVSTPQATVGRIAPVYTVPASRGHGYAAALTHRLAEHLLTLCDIVMLYADAANSVSNGVYERLGFEARAEVLELTLT